MAWHKNCVKKNLAHFGKLWIEYSTATLSIHPLHDTPDKQSLANLFLQFFNDIIERICSKFPSSYSPIPIFFQSFLHIYLISIKPLPRKFIISFLLLNVIHLIKIINSLSESCHFHTRDICRIFHLFPLYVATSLANSLFFSKLDYFNSLYNAISQANLNKIQRIQNALARVVTHTSNLNTSQQCSNITLAFNLNLNIYSNNLTFVFKNSSIILVNFLSGQQNN